MITVTDATFDELVTRSPLPVLLDFTADWCPPCRMMKPVLREVAAELAGRLIVAQLDADTNHATMVRSGVLGLPTLNLYVDGEVVTQLVGARPKATLLRALQEHLPVPAPSA